MMNYDEKFSQLKLLLEIIDEVYTDICRTDYAKAEEALNGKMQEIAQSMTELIGKAEILLQYGVEVPKDIIVAQMNNLLEAYEQKDRILLADTLHFEIADTLKFYQEIIMAVKQENILI